MRLPNPQWCERPRQKDKAGLKAKLLEDLQVRGGTACPVGSTRAAHQHGNAAQRGCCGRRGAASHGQLDWVPAQGCVVVSAAYGLASYSAPLRQQSHRV
jgi:hypothetical protein